MTTKTTTMTMARMITAIRSMLPRGRSLSKEKAPASSKRNLQYLQTRASRGQTPRQFGQDWANILSDIVQKYHVAQANPNSTVGLVDGRVHTAGLKGLDLRMPEGDNDRSPIVGGCKRCHA
jgi:hypothetical protein